MAIVGFNFTKILAGRDSAGKGKIQINNNIAIREIKESRISVDEKKATVKVSFRFDSIYEPRVARISLEGDVLLLIDKKEADQLITGWNEKKQVPTTTMTNTLNHVLERCNIQALILSRDLNLPSPVPMPKVNIEGAPSQAGTLKNAKTSAKKPRKSKGKK